VGGIRLQTLEQMRRNSDVLADLNASFARIEDKVDGLDRKLGVLDGKFERLDGQVSALDWKVDRLRTSIPRIVRETMEDVFREWDEKR
jgi:hypothetical protein